MPNTLTWSLLPRGLDPGTGRAQLSLVASPAVTSSTGLLGDSVLADWPFLVREALPRMRLRAGGNRTPIGIVPGPVRPDSVTWKRIFPPGAPLGTPPGAPPGSLDSATSSGAFERAHAAAAALYEQALRTDPTQKVAHGSPVGQAIAALGRLTASVTGDAAARAATGVPARVVDLLDPGGLTTGRLDEAVDALFAAGLEAEAQVAPLVPYVVRQQRQHRQPDSAQNPPQSPGPLPDFDPDIPRVDSADVHQVLGLLGDHPEIARRVGLIVDLEADLSPLVGTSHLLRVVDGDALPMAGVFETVRHPWSSVVLDRQRRTLRMATRADADAEIRDGMLDLRPDARGTGYVVGDLDVRSIAHQLQVIATTIPDGGQVTERAPAVAPPPDADDGIALPVRRDPGFVVAQTSRLDTVARPSLALPRRLADPAAGRADESFEGDAVLFADDVTSGYRVDVSRNGRPFQSLMRRVARYAIAGTTKGEVIEVHDEGVVEPLTAVAELDGAGGSSVTIGEEVFGWDGFSLGAELPGPKVLGDTPGADVASIESSALKGYGIATRVAVEPASLPVLRYGDTYEFRARAVDLTGGSLPPEVPDRAMASAPATFRRHDVVAPPTLVLRRPLSAGETLHRIVVRSDGEGRPLGGTSERHLAPPSAAVRLVERHGRLDAAFGPDSPQRRAARRAMLEVASRESGSFTDPVVSDGRGGTVAAEGIGVVSTTDEPPVPLPLPPGVPLPPGQYVFHDTDRLRVPYLPDPGASGVVMLVPLTGPEGVFATYGPGPWPQARPVRLVASAGTATSPDFSVRTTPDGDVIDCPLVPGIDVTMALASQIHGDVVDVMDPIDPQLRGLAVAGFIVAFSPRQTIQLVHATRKPVQDPVLTVGPPTARVKGQTTLVVKAAHTVHGPTTGRVDTQASWTEVVDDGVGPVELVQRSAVLGSRPVARQDTTLAQQQVTYDFADTKRRDLQLRAVAATRFRDCFPELPVGDPSTVRTSTAVPFAVQNSSIPPAPEIHSVVPVYRWTRTKEGGVTTSTRERTGVRIYLRRPWCVTGTGESLGVIVYSSQVEGNVGDRDRLTGLVSRWGRDTVEGDAVASQRLGPASFPLKNGTVSAFLPREIPTLNSTNPGLLVACLHEVRYAEDRDLWYADVAVTLDYDLPYFLRLALVRYQFPSASGCHTSRIVVTDWIPVGSDDRVDVRPVGPDEVEVDVHVTMTDAIGRRYEAALEPRLVPLPPGAPRGTPQVDITTAVPAVPLQNASPAPTVLVKRGRVKITATDPAERARLRQGRLVVREVQSGEHVAKPGGAERVRFLETFDWASVVGAS